MTIKKQLFASERNFQLYRYTVSHLQLLLRSNKSVTEFTRIEILFKCVDLIQIPTTFDGLIITEHSLDSLDLDKWPIIQWQPTSNRFFELRTRTITGAIIANAVFFSEDDKEYNEPSNLYVDARTV